MPLFFDKPADSACKKKRGGIFSLPEGTRQNGARRYLKIEPERHLDDARVMCKYKVRAIEFGETHRVEIAYARSRNGRDIVDRARHVLRVIEDIKEVSTELYPFGFSKPEVLEDG
jgi:hypothetical protein